ncbi:tyrosine-type recombinase/integrase (plasmid) [Rhizobium lusitanum]|uniref:tyrosine-type recombinase/integrase n=1 Tax=Rhizobium lusitanum TaxID=293958 RepID=UPI00160AD740|nr:tyrosine-type recombinase/integrase [Rhizobium lusitanum]QND44636.1 tyrosine-type recombinase/integrase [Rhizobium lusitanum]QND44747.1 tyrosine-type recombinase/integrase [Rhizobium lusitanum]
MTTTINLYSRQLWQRFDGWIFREDVEGYITRMQAAGYRLRSICRATRMVGEYARWLIDDHNDGSDVSPKTVSSFLSHRRKIGKLRNGDRSAVFRFLAEQLDAGAVDGLPIADPHEQILNSFSEYLRRTRGFHPTTIKASVYYARPFFREIWNGADELAQISRQDIISYIERHVRDRSISTMQGVFTRLRSFLRYLFTAGLLDKDLSSSIPAISGRRHAKLPKFLTPVQLQSVLDACNRTTSAGRRDYAILLLLARLGLRAHEVSKLALDDIDWQIGVVSITGKAGTQSVLPLPCDVGTAIADYLVNDRPSSVSRQVFLRLETRKVGFPTATGVILVATRALKRAGITGIANVRSHVFRHTLATDMIRSGATLNEIGQVLRHLSHDTTRIYAKVDLPRLRLLSQPWPEGAR